MKLLLKSEFARLCKVQRTSITRAIRRGDVIEEKTGGINPDHPVNIFYKNEVLEKRAYREVINKNSFIFKK